MNYPETLRNYFRKTCYIWGKGYFPVVFTFKRPKKIIDIIFHGSQYLNQNYVFFMNLVVLNWLNNQKKYGQIIRGFLMVM